MLKGSLIAFLAAGTLFAAARDTNAQYMYLDTDGDGVHTAADQLVAGGTTSIDIWLDTNHDRDGSLQSCNSHTGAPSGGASLDLFQYTIVLRAMGGTVSWGSFAAADPSYTVDGADLRDDHDTEFSRSRPPGTVTSAGLVKLGAITAAILSGAPSVEIGTSTPLNPFGFGTGFGTTCDASEFPNTYVLGTDWFDVDGAASAVPNEAPAISAPASHTAAEGDPVALSATATDADAADVLTISQSGAPASLTLSTSPGPSPVSATLSGTLGAGDAAGSPYDIQWSVQDGAGGSASAATLLTVTAPDRAPVVTAPSSVLGAETVPLQIGAGASDPDGDPITSLTAAPLPAGATFTPNAFLSAGSFDWTPALGQAGTYTVTFTAQSGAPALSGSASTAITIGPPDNAPVITAPASVTVNEGAALTVSATCSDPDGDAITSFTCVGTQNTPLPEGAVWTPNANLTVGALTWTPTFSQAGIYNVDFEATSGSLNLTALRVTKITVRDVDRPPVVTAPAAFSGAEGVLLTLAVSAADPDGGAIAALTAAPLPQGATFVTDPGNASGTFSWTPGFSQEGTYPVTFTASNALSGSATTQITIAHSNEPPALSAPQTQAVDEGALLTFSVSATDGDGDHVALSAQSLPLGAGFSDQGNNTGTFSWTPGFGQAGTYPVTFAGNDGNGGAATASTAITVQNVNRAPAAQPGGPYSGLTNVPVTFDGTASSDPDGDALTYAWDFGDLAAGSGPAPDHTYGASGSYTVVLTVTDTGSPALSSSASTTATISPSLTARVFTTHAYSTIRLASGKPTWCAQVEPIDGGFQISDVNLATLTLRYGASEISASTERSVVGADRDGNGVQEITACFAKGDLRTLFAGLPAGRQTVRVTVEALLDQGGSLSGDVDVEVIATGGALLTASVSPNPLNPRATLTFRTARPGPARARLYDSSGRLVRTLLDEGLAAAGYHDVNIDGRGDGGERLSSGVYFYRVETADGIVSGPLTIVK